MWKSQERLNMDKDIIFQGDCLTSLKTLPDNSINCCITSPPYYGLRDYGVDGQIGLEATPELFIDNLVNIFREVKRVLKDDGTLWVNIGDSYYGGGIRGTDYNPTDDLKSKDLIGIPWMLAFALRADGWYLRQDIIWHKPNPMPESVKDRCTKSHEYIFLLSKQSHYYFDYKSIQEEALTGETIRDKNAEGYNPNYPNGARFSKGEHVYGKDGKRNKRDVWSVSVKPNKEAHFATFPEELVTPMILSGCPKDGIVLDPFMGSGTVGAVAKKLYRNYVGCELNPEYVKMAENRIGVVTTKVNSRLFDLM